MPRTHIAIPSFTGYYGVDPQNSRKVLVDYKSRTLGPALREAAAFFPIVLLTGPRQVGKTTLLRACVPSGTGYVTLDDFDARQLAQRDPALFLQTYPAPMIIDEVQYAPEIFSALKIAVDTNRIPGSYYLTGSQKFHLMHGVSESLAGRVAIFDLLGFSQAERDGRVHGNQPFFPTSDWLDRAAENAGSYASLEALYRTIWQGSYPQSIAGGTTVRDIFYRSYIETYIQRDVRALIRVGSETAFLRFLRAAAARTGQLLNFAEVARDVDVDLKTVQAWFSILETSGIVMFLQPYFTNITKRLIKRPKMYFLDTGLCAYLSQWSSPQSLEAGAMSGAILETFMLAEIIKSYWHNARAVNIYFYRDRDQREIDLLIESDGMLFPVEFKKTATPSTSAIKHFSALEALPAEIGPGAVVCLRESPIQLTQTVSAIPVGFL